MRTALEKKAACDEVQGGARCHTTHKSHGMSERSLEPASHKPRTHFAHYPPRGGFPKKGKTKHHHRGQKSALQDAQGGWVGGGTCVWGWVLNVKYVLLQQSKGRRTGRGGSRREGAKDDRRLDAQ